MPSPRCIIFLALIILTAPHSLRGADEEPYCYWKLDGTLEDSGTSGLRLKEIGGPLAGEGVIGQAYEIGLNGAPQALYSMEVKVAAEDNLTFTAWIKPDSLLPGFSDTSPHTIARLYLAADASSLDFRIRDEHLEIFIHPGQSGQSPNFSANELMIEAGKWTFVAFTKEGNQVTLYAGEHSQSFVLPNGSDFDRLFLGAGYRDSQRTLNGALDEVRLYKRALPPEEIQKLRSEGTAVH